MAIEIVDLPSKNGDFPLLFVCSPEGTFFRPPGCPPGQTHRARAPTPQSSFQANEAIDLRQLGVLMGRFRIPWFLVSVPTTHNDLGNSTPIFSNKNTVLPNFWAILHQFLNISYHLMLHRTTPCVGTGTPSKGTNRWTWQTFFRILGHAKLAKVVHFRSLTLNTHQFSRFHPEFLFNKWVCLKIGYIPNKIAI